MANSAEMALDVGEGLAAATLERTKDAREALLAEAASIAARPAAVNLALKVGFSRMRPNTSHAEIWLEYGGGRGMGDGGMWWWRGGWGAARRMTRTWTCDPEVCVRFLTAQ